MVSYKWDCSIWSLTKLHQTRRAPSQSEGGLFCPKKVCKGSLNPRTISEYSQSGVAAGIEQTSDFSGLVIVVDMNRPFAATELPSAKFAASPSSFDERSIFFRRNAVSMFSLVVLVGGTSFGITLAFLFVVFEALDVVLTPTPVGLSAFRRPCTSTSHSLTFSLGIQV